MAISAQNAPPMVPSQASNYTLDFSGDISLNSPGQTISSFTVTSDPGITVVSSTCNVALTAVLVRLTGGRAGQSYNVTVTATYTDGTVMPRSFVVPVVDSLG